MVENGQDLEKIILVAVSTESDSDVNESLDELEELVKTAGGIVVGRIIQNREAVHNGTYVGKGKLLEILELADETGADAIVCDDELSPAQYKNMEDILNLKIMDRTLVILDIFAKRANTKEGKIQVELALLRYRSTRLIGMRNFSRQGGSSAGISKGMGIGSRGPGEKKLEVDRRLIKNKISQLKLEVSELQKHRDITRAKRKKKHIPVVAVVGYTNAGKSTLLNKLTDAGVLEEDKLFATLDPTTRLLEIDDGQQVLMTDTVGFIRKLPHHLIDAFKSTLEEAKYADIILHVADASNPSVEKHLEAVYETLDKLEVKDKIIITLLNKQDKLDNPLIIKDLRADYTINISAKTGQGFDSLFETLSTVLRNSKCYIERLFSYNEAGMINEIRKYGQLVKEEYTEDGIYVEAYVPKQLYK